MRLSVRSPADEEGVHDSFQQLIAEHRDNGAASSALELQQLQSDLDEESRGKKKDCLHVMNELLFFIYIKNIYSLSSCLKCLYHL